MSEGLMKIILALISIAGTVVSYFLIPYLKSITTKQQRNDLIFWLGIGMTSAEYMFDIPKSGEEKKKFVMNLIKTKVKISDEDLSMMIDTIIERYNEALDEYKETDIATTIIDAVSEFIV